MMTFVINTMGRLAWPLLCLLVLASCTGQVDATSRLAGDRLTPIPSTTPLPLSPTSTVTPATVPTGGLVITIYYPAEDSELQTGQPVKFTVQVFDSRGNALTGARVSISVRDPAGQLVATLPAAARGGTVYRSDYWTIPHQVPAGEWRVEVKAQAGSAQGSSTGRFKVKSSTADILRSKYGFWLDPPALGAIESSLYGEKGDARNGMVRWGGFRPQMHIMPANWVDVQWREGDYHLDSPETVRRFMLAELGDLGFTPIRTIGPFERTQFKSWPAWRVGGQGKVGVDQVEWLIFYAPEVNKTYSIGTTVVLPPAGGDPHVKLRESFAVYPGVTATGVAPGSLARLLPGPELVSPALAAQFEGLAEPIVLQWQPVKELAADEYYEVTVDYNYGENNPAVTYQARQTRLILPETLYHTPNCHIFNWQVRLMRQTGVDAAGRPQGEAISYPSLYWYVRWLYPPDEKEPFAGVCINQQY